MKIDKREKTSVETYHVYVANDGTEFSNRQDCEDYECQQEIKQRQIQYKETADIDGYKCVLWYIKSQEEFDWLYSNVWYHTMVKGTFSEPGWYIAKLEISYNDWDETYVYFFNDYIKEYEDEIARLKHLTSE